MASVQTKNNTYYFVIHDKVTKKNKWVNSTIKVDPKNPKRSYRKAELALAAYEQEMEEAALRDAEEEAQREKAKQEEAKIPLADYFSVWLESHKDEVRPNTYSSYASAINNHIVPYFKEHPVAIQDVRPKHMNGYFETKRKTLSACTLRKHRSYMTAMFRYARLNELMTHNPMENVVNPPKKKYKSEVYADDAMAQLLALAKEQDEPIFPAIYLAAKLGLRRSEVAGARWHNVDWKGKTLRIATTVVYYEGVPVEVRETKNDSSYRKVPLTSKVIEFLKEIQAEQERNRLALGPAYKNEYNDCICTWADGRPISPNTMSSRFELFLKRNGLQKIRFHDLRHSAATALLKEERADVKVVSKLLGHSQVSTTYDIYAHILEEDALDALTHRDENFDI